MKTTESANWNTTSPLRNQPLPEPAPTRTSPARAWILAVRPKTLGASIVPVAVGSAVAKIEGEFQPAIAFACLAAALLLQVAANLINDAIDFLKGVDTEMRRGPRRVTQHGLIPAPTVLWAAGVRASPLLASLGVPLDRQGRVEVTPDLSIPGHPDVFVLGDAASCAGPEEPRCRAWPRWRSSRVATSRR